MIEKHAYANNWKRAKIKCGHENTEKDNKYNVHRKLNNKIKEKTVQYEIYSVFKRS